MIRETHSPPSAPRVGVPYRTRKEEVTGDVPQLGKYLEAVRKAGGTPVPVSLGLTAGEIERLADTLDAVVLSGSPADIEPSLFQAARHRETAPADPDRERTDFALLEHLLAKQKPILAICYGIQSLNVFLGGTLVQDIPTEVGTKVPHDWEDQRGDPETFHSVQVEGGSRLARIAPVSQIRVNSSHHQSIGEPGRKLHVVSRAPDGVVEAVEWTGDANWVVGVQWHPERMVETDAVAQGLFRNLVEAAIAKKNAVEV
jgi:putative glutamine amidotransferase